MIQEEKSASGYAVPSLFLVDCDVSEGILLRKILNEFSLRGHFNN